MTEFHHAPFGILRRWISISRRYRRRVLTKRLLNELPAATQRDIGWNGSTFDPE